ncbi:tumor necrosis factor receptor superfamily member 19L [Rhinichthys klamathensis goyatoka]|uniref:tumor necrosis factor receptor superfamily member 19L n=1 Tax=Rhinichthys klamathensis goyatoka TaxID=3034132 RepID=UPI0024B6316A|nr:tumor necrosis factor receptor superfamily member 19L [Rhinichthys klamathensis goyatoka]
MKNHLYCSAPVCLILLELWGTLAAQCRWEDGCVCPLCPAGQEPTTACGEVEGPGEAGLCRTCPAGTFSDNRDPEPCRPHISCSGLNRWITTAPTSHSDAVCGGCLPGFHPAAKRKSSTLHACVRKPYSRRRRNAVRSTPSRSGVGGANATNVQNPEEKSAEYAVFALVPIFCVMGLLGILICNLLKKKGYRCNAEKEGIDAEAATPQKEANPCPYIVDDPNEDTISILVRLITEKKENAAALEELLQEYEDKQMALNKSSSIKFPALPHFSQFRSLPRLCTHQHHLHTINGLASRSGLCCSRCSQKKWPELLLPALALPADTHKSPTNVVKTPEVTILSVGRFQVAQIPEMKSASKEVTQPESSDTDSVDSGHTEPAEERSLLGVSSSSNSSSSKCRQEINI